MNTSIENLKMQQFIDRFREDFEQFWNEGKIERAFELSKLVSNDPKKVIRYDLPPHPFYGNLYAETVMVNLNAGIPSDLKETSRTLKEERGINDFDDYFDYLFKFGDIRYPDNATVDNFDAKQIAFLLKYDEVTKLLGFEERNELNETCSYMPNLRKLLSNRCQLELIPYGSTQFDAQYFKKNRDLLNYFKDLIEMISSVERKIIFFNGRVFRDLLELCKEEFEVKMSPRIGSQLIKKDGTIANRHYYHSSGKLTSNSQEISFVVADSFSQQGLNGDLMRQYGELVIRGVFTEN